MALVWRRLAAAVLLAGFAGIAAACQVNLPVRGPSEEVFMGADTTVLTTTSNAPWDTSFEIITKNRNHLKGKLEGGKWVLTLNRNPTTASFAANLVRGMTFGGSTSSTLPDKKKSAKEQILSWLEEEQG